MKTTIGDLRKLVTETRNERDIEEYDNLHVGDWFVNSRGTVSKLDRLYYRAFGGGRGDILMAQTSGGESTMTQRYDVWSRDVRPATHEEVKDAQASWATAGSKIDTSREGT